MRISSEKRKCISPEMNFSCCISAMLSNFYKIFLNMVENSFWENSHTLSQRVKCYFHQFIFLNLTKLNEFSFTTHRATAISVLVDSWPKQVVDKYVTFNSFISFFKFKIFIFISSIKYYFLSKILFLLRQKIIFLI